MLTPRDRQLLQDLHEIQVLSVSQIAYVHYGGSSGALSAARRGTNRLAHLGVVLKVNLLWGLRGAPEGAVVLPQVATRLAPADLFLAWARAEAWAWALGSYRVAGADGLDPGLGLGADVAWRCETGAGGHRHYRIYVLTESRDVPRWRDAITDPYQVRRPDCSESSCDLHYAATVYPPLDAEKVANLSANVLPEWDMLYQVPEWMWTDESGAVETFVRPWVPVRSLLASPSSTG
jgi:hypothetical protein